MPRHLFVCVALVTASCAARDAAKLATITSDHVNKLNIELTQYAADANALRKQDAIRIAAARSRWDQDAAYNQQIFTQWQIDNASAPLRALDALQKQSAADMARTDSLIKRQSDDQAQLEAAYGKVTYDPAKLASVVAQLQALAKRAEASTQLQLNAKFAAAVVSDAKNDLAAAKIKPAGAVK
jgi:hypothetical protein